MKEVVHKLVSECDSRNYRIYIMLFLSIYVVEILYITVLSRSSSGVLDYELAPFWSYIEAIKGDSSLAWEIGANILMYVPLGFMLRGLGPNWKKAAALALMLCCMTETLQLICCLGLFEFDDIFNNAMGGMAGYALANILNVRGEKYILICTGFVLAGGIIGATCA